MHRRLVLACRNLKIFLRNFAALDGLRGVRSRRQMSAQRAENIGARAVRRALKASGAMRSRVRGPADAGRRRGRHPLQFMSDPWRTPSDLGRQWKIWESLGKSQTVWEGDFALYLRGPINHFKGLAGVAADVRRSFFSAAIAACPALERSPSSTPRAHRSNGRALLRSNCQTAGRSRRERKEHIMNIGMVSNILIAAEVRGNFTRPIPLAGGTDR